MPSLAEIAQLGERQTEDLKVPGSMPESLIELWIIPGLGISFFKMSSFVRLFYFVLDFPVVSKLNFPFWTEIEEMHLKGIKFWLIQNELFNLMFRLGVYEFDSKNHMIYPSLVEIAQLGERQKIWRSLVQYWRA